VESLVTAFTLFRVQVGSSDLVCYNLTQIFHVQEVYVVYGNYDIIAKVEAGTMREL
jgi:DNA-binding Lrp family transcriptional regulator